MECVTVNRLLAGWVAGDLASDEAEGVADHVARCPRCQREQIALARVARELQDLPRSTAPARVAAAVQRGVARAPREATSEGRGARSVPPPLRCAPVETPLGAGFAAYTAKGIAYLALGTDAAAFQEAVERRLGVWPPLETEAPPTVREAVAAALDPGAWRHADLPPMADFQRRVLDVVARIPPGEVRSYAWVAKEVGKPRAVRAVGNAVARNPVPLLIPCHRVVRSDGLIGNYALGSAMKRRVLALEGVDVEALERDARAGVRLVGSATTRIFCLPTCGHARRIQPRHRVLFSSFEQATAAGFRPCQVCRPA